MDPNRFDAVSRIFASRRLSRRGAVKGAAAGLTAGALRTTASAQDATPAGDLTASGAMDSVTKTSFLFVQSFQSGTITPMDGKEDRYTVTLAAGLGQTIYFSDRPERIVGATPTPQFLEGLGFPEDNPPNAALVVETGSGETDIAVIELFSPRYDPVSQGVTYEVEVLSNWETSTEQGFAEAPTDLAAVAPSFGTAHLFIDDCPNLDILCVSQWGDNIRVFEGEPLGYYKDQGTCWNYSVCMPCEPYGHEQPYGCATYNYWRDRCNADFPECRGACYVQTAWPFAEFGC